jgi:viroplasmin and RNaseH domain-containing protein
VDGSHINGATGYGAVILKDGEVIEELSGAVTDSSLAETRQVAGELRAVEEALSWCKRNGVNEVSIFYDYDGIEKWATGAWKTNQALTQGYARAVGSSPIRIRWRKVTSHTGDRWNDRADLLAKRGAGTALPAASDDRLMTQLSGAADGFIEFLMLNGIDATFERVFNEQFARIRILEQERAVGIFDLYNTRKKRLSPYLHAFNSDSLKSRVEELWGEFSGRDK